MLYQLGGGIRAMNSGFVTTAIRTNAASSAVVICNYRLLLLLIFTIGLVFQFLLNADTLFISQKRTRTRPIRIG